MYGTLDTDGSGKVDRAEFTSWYLGEGGASSSRSGMLAGAFLSRLRKIMRKMIQSGSAEAQAKRTVMARVRQTAREAERAHFDGE